MKNNWIVHKFGGSSLKDAACFARVAGIIADGQKQAQAVVVSAPGGTTDALLGLVTLAAAQADAWKQELDALRSRYRGIAETLLTADNLAPVLDPFEEDCQSIGDILRGMARLRAATGHGADVIAGFGEIWSARLLSALMQQDYAQTFARFGWLDAREVIVVAPGEMGPAVDWPDSQTRLDRWRQPPVGEPATGMVVTGFIASDAQGLQTTLGRNGSDFTASIMGALLRASEINIWTDVAGVMSSDPRRVPEAKVIDTMSYNEAMELAYFGARVIHPQTMGPAVEHGIPLRIRSSFEPALPGTVVGVADTRSAFAVKGITAVEDVALINLEGAGMIGVPGTADRLFGALREVVVSVIMISQGSSEHSICFAVPSSGAALALAAARRAFATELARGQVQSIEASYDCSILAVVGDDMAGQPGISAKFFSTLGHAGINVRAIGPPAAEAVASAVVAAADTTRALRAVHSGFYLSAKTLSIGVLGAGTVGAVLLDQIGAQAAQLRERFKLDLRVRAITSSRDMSLDDHRIDLEHWRETRQQVTQPMDYDQFADHVAAEHLPHAVIVDCTAADATAQRYEQWMARGIHIVTPNKKANSGSTAYYHALKRLQQNSNVHFLYEATVGAGLPIISTLKDLVDTGDELHQIEGIFSGTLAYLFNLYDGSGSFAELVSDARARGYTEPDPRDDLSGMDVARKAVILAREAGLTLELEDLQVQSLIPPGLEQGDAESFLTGLRAHDDTMRERVMAAREAGQVLRYVARIDFQQGTASVELMSVAADHPFAVMNLTDNIVKFVTARYSENPLIVQGPGAGPEVTAAGVFADILRLGSYVSG